MRTSCLLTLAVVALLLSGCGTNRPDTVPVSGTITIDGAAPPKAGTIYFTPSKAAPGFPKKPGLADFDANGDFTTTTYEPGDGLMPGKYLAVVHCWEVEPNVEGIPAKSFLPKSYDSASTSGLEVEVEPGSRAIKLQWDLKTEAGQGGGAE